MNDLHLLMSSSGHQQLEALSCDISLPGAPFAKAAPQLQQKLQQIKATMRPFQGEGDVIVKHGGWNITTCGFSHEAVTNVEFDRGPG